MPFASFNFDKDVPSTPKNVEFMKLFIRKIGTFVLEIKLTENIYYLEIQNVSIEYKWKN